MWLIQFPCYWWVHFLSPITCYGTRVFARASVPWIFVNNWRPQVSEAAWEISGRTPWWHHQMQTLFSTALDNTKTKSKSKKTHFQTDVQLFSSMYIPCQAIESDKDTWESHMTNIIGIKWHDASHRQIWPRALLRFDGDQHNQCLGYPAKRALPAMLTHDRWGPFGRIPSMSPMLMSDQ